MSAAAASLRGTSNSFESLWLINHLLPTTEQRIVRLWLPSMVELEKQELEAKRKHYDLMMVDFVSRVSRAIVVRSTLFKIYNNITQTS